MSHEIIDVTDNVVLLTRYSKRQAKDCQLEIKAPKDTPKIDPKLVVTSNIGSKAALLALVFAPYVPDGRTSQPTQDVCNEELVNARKSLTV